MMKKMIDCSILWSFHIWFEVTTYCLLQFNRHYFSCIARVKFVKTFFCRLICFESITENLHYCLFWTKMLKLLVEIMELQ